MNASWQRIAEWPQFSYLRHRSALDAVVRVTSHAKAVRLKVQSQRKTVHQLALKQPNVQICGGFQIHIDVKRAFGSASRQLIFARLAWMPVRNGHFSQLAQWNLLCGG